MDMSAPHLWEKTLEVLVGFLSEVNTLNYFGGSSGVSLENNVLRVLLPEDKDEAFLMGTLKSVIDTAVKQAGGPEGIKVEFFKQKIEETKPLSEDGSNVSHLAMNTNEDEAFSSNLTFDNFVVGPSNQFAVAMAKYVAQHPGDEANRTNPLFMYGPTGVGKTHLMHAIGNLARSINPKLKVLYTTSEGLMNEYVRSWRSDELKEPFRRKFRTPDILLVDDIQYMAKRPGLQDEFFNIFNALKDSGHQIVMTSDRAPKDIPDLVDRLVSRFISGICADVDIPAYETRFNILMLKMQSYPDIRLSQRVLEFIAQNVTSSVRALEGALSKTVNYARMYPGQSETLVTPEILEKSILREYIQNESSIVYLTCEEIQRAVCKYYGVKLEDLLGKSRVQEITMPRQVAMFLCRTLTPSTMMDIGKAFDRNHATVNHACNTIKNFTKTGEHDLLKALKELVEPFGKSISDIL